MPNNLQSHWDTVYKFKTDDQMSWTQFIPKTSLDFIHSFGLDKSAKIIDVGGGNSKLAECLLDEGYENISVLDISAEAILNAQKRLGNRANQITWIVTDITEFKPNTTFDIWHDRATFHFLTSVDQIKKYLTIASNYVNKFLTMGTFSTLGPTKCSGLEIKQYNEETLSLTLQSGFEKIKCITEDHMTPFNTVQNFLFCSFKKQ